ncbi:putative sulfate exporter family transporter, partial [Acinetobacter baumannii]
EFGTIAKLSRVAMLAPMVIALGLMTNRSNRKAGVTSAGGRAPMPWFVLGFAGLVGLNSIVTIPPEAKSIIVTATTVLLSMALAAMG